MNARTMALAAAATLTLATVAMTAAGIWFWVTNPLAVATATNSVDLGGFVKSVASAIYETLVFLLRYF